MKIHTHTHAHSHKINDVRHKSKSTTKKKLCLLIQCLTICSRKEKEWKCWLKWRNGPRHNVCFNDLYFSLFVFVTKTDFVIFKRNREKSGCIMRLVTSFIWWVCVRARFSQYVSIWCSLSAGCRLTLITPTWLILCMLGYNEDFADHHLMMSMAMTYVIFWN